MSMSFTGNRSRIPGQAKASVRLATLSDESLLWELGMLHATRTAEANTDADADADEARIVELETEYLRRHPVSESEPVLRGQPTGLLTPRQRVES